MARRALAVLRLDGLVPYSQGLALQQTAEAAVAAGSMPDTLILLQVRISNVYMVFRSLGDSPLCMFSPHLR